MLAVECLLILERSLCWPITSRVYCLLMTLAWPVSVLTSLTTQKTGGSYGLQAIPQTGVVVSAIVPVLGVGEASQFY